jgi:hypothetical protein
MKDVPAFRCLEQFRPTVWKSVRELNPESSDICWYSIWHGNLTVPDIPDCRCGTVQERYRSTGGGLRSTKVLIVCVGGGYVECARRDMRVRVTCRREPQFENWVIQLLFLWYIKESLPGTVSHDTSVTDYRFKVR